MNQMQALMDGMNAQWQRERAATQMTLGKMIEVLGGLPSDALIDGIGNAHSYRGYYSDLAFEKVTGKITVADALTMCRAAMGEVFTGYKGGKFQMGKLTPLWVADYGCGGVKLMGISADGTLDTEDDE